MFDPTEHTSEEDMQKGGAANIPPDIYLVRFEDLERKNSQSSGQDYLNCRLRVVDGKYEDSVVYDMISLSEAAMWKLAEACFSLNWRKELDIEDDDDLKNALVGRVGKIRTKWEEYEGEKRTKIAKWYLLTDEEREAHPGKVTSKKNTNNPSNKGKKKKKGKDPLDPDDHAF